MMPDGEYAYAVIWFPENQSNRICERFVDYRAAEKRASEIVMDRSNYEVEVYKFFETVDLLPVFKRGAS